MGVQARCPDGVEDGWFWEDLSMVAIPADGEGDD